MKIPCIYNISYYWSYLSKLENYGKYEKNVEIENLKEKNGFYLFLWDLDYFGYFGINVDDWTWFGDVLGVQGSFESTEVVE